MGEVRAEGAAKWLTRLEMRLIGCLLVVIIWGRMPLYGNGRRLMLMSGKCWKKWGQG